MITISKNQSLERWDELTETLREALVSESNSDFLWKTAEAENVPEEKIYTVAQVAGYVLMGFLHPEDVAQELKDRLNLDPRTTKDIQDALNQRIFAPLRVDIDKFYKPVSKLEAASSGPVILNDINLSSQSSPAASIQSVKPAPTGINTATSQTLSGAPSIKSTAIPNSNIVPNAPKTNRLSDIGWSRSGTAAPVVKLDITQPPASMPKPPGVPSGATQQHSPSPAPSSAAASSALGEFERLSAMKKSQNIPSGVAGIPPLAAAPKPSTVAPVPNPAPVVGVSKEPAPFILHQDSSFTAPSKNSDFKMPQAQVMTDMQSSSGRFQAMAKPAVLEFAGQANKPQGAPGPSKSVVHYTDFQDSLSKVPTQASSGPRQVNQVMPPMPAQPIAAARQAPALDSMPLPPPPMPPTAPVPQAPQTQEQVIVKDFL